MSTTHVGLACRARLRLVVAVLAAAVATAGCAGPRAPLGVGIREVPSDIVLGDGRTAPAEPVVIPVPPVALPLTPLPPAPSLRLPDRRPPERPQAPAAVPAPPAPPVEACPEADPRAAPPDEARNTVTAPPVPATYTFRSSGGYEITGADAATGRFPETSTRTVKNVHRLEKTAETWYRFDVEAVLGDLTTTTTYTIVPETDTPIDSAAVGAGLYLTRLVSSSVTGEPQRFEPATDPGLLLLPFPAVPGHTWHAAGTDPQSGITLSYSGEVGPKVRVEACRVPLDAWPVHLDGAFGTGGAVGPDGAQSFTADYAFGTAYGGLSLQDSVVMDRTSVGGNVHQEIAATINRRPALATTAGVPSCPGSCTP